MSTSTQATIVDRLVGAVPESYRVEVARFARSLRDRFPPILLARRIESAERHLDRRLKELDGKLDEVLRRLEHRRG